MYITQRQQYLCYFGEKRELMLMTVRIDRVVLILTEITRVH
jgi:hypothetical protein